MPRAGPKSRKGKAGPKSKKAPQKEEVEKVVTESEEEEEVVQKENDNVSEEEAENDNGTNEEEDEEDDEPPAKKGRGRPAAAKGGKKKGGKPAGKAAAKGRPASRGRKTPAAAASKKKAEESDSGEDSGTEYEVDYILDSRKRKGATEYQIKWKGYSKNKATWEPESNLSCEDAIKEYEAKQKKREETPGASLRANRKETQRYADIAGTGAEHRMRHSKRMSTKSPRKSYREEVDSD